MAFRVKLPDAIVIEADTEQELATVLRYVRSPQLVLALEVDTPAARARERLADAQLDTAALRDFMGRVPRPYRRIIEALLNAPNGLRDTELKAALGLEKNTALGGTMAGLSKSLKKKGLTIGQLLTKESHTNGTGRYVSYRLTGGAREAVMQ